MASMADRNSHTPDITYLRDYQQPGFVIDRTTLIFNLDDTLTRVRARLVIRRNPDSHPDNKSAADLILDGDQLNLVSIALDGVALNESRYRVTDTQLTIPDAPDAFTLETVVEIEPKLNTALMGLYLSSSNLCTQCEAEGFRRITWYLDRPDVLSVFTVAMIADQQRYPVLLSNGNEIDMGDYGKWLDDDLLSAARDEASQSGRHMAVWHDPWPKPSYLFAIVAGQLSVIEQSFTTASGRHVALKVYSEPHNIDKCDHAMASLVKSMQWDEEVYGREYDLDVYMIVAVDDFNMGAMENKGLNIFNSKYVLAKPQIATDQDYEAIEGVIGHEYFHNWSGNRVTCRDWFQLSLKEGFTVFRDQEFSADVTSRGVKRIDDVNVLRVHQFREDAGPTAHPVRPDSYAEINNFYTTTIYNKGAEVVRMMHGLLGPDGFRKGTDLYFDQYDGQAVTIENFVSAMEQSNGIDLNQFRRWYSQAGTPRINVQRSFDAARREYTLTLSQSCPPTPGQDRKQPFHIPVAMGLYHSTTGEPLAAQCQRDDVKSGVDPNTHVLSLREAQESFVFTDLDQEPMPSLLRGFSAPVIIDAQFSNEELGFLMAHDSDPFNRWDAGQQLIANQIVSLMEQDSRREQMQVEPLLVDAWRATLTTDLGDRAFQAKALALPSEALIAERMDTIDPDAIARARDHVQQHLGQQLYSDWHAVYQSLTNNADYQVDQVSVGKRALRNLCLRYLAASPTGDTEGLALAQFNQAGNMTDELAAFGVLTHSQFDSAQYAIDTFFERWNKENLVIDKWFAIQAMSPNADTLARVKALTEHQAFSFTNPNRVRSLIGVFATGNQRHFHGSEGAGYAFVGEWVRRLDALNPQIAARLVSAFSLWRRFDDDRQQNMQDELKAILNQESVSRDVSEIVNKSLA